MNRQLKFRAWDDSKKKFIPEFNLTENGDIFRINAFETCESLDVTVSQFTGLADMFGKEIYEGDILRLYEYAGEIEMPVVFHRGSFCIFGFNWRVEKSEVIGNIHEGSGSDNHTRIKSIIAKRLCDMLCTDEDLAEVKRWLKETLLMVGDGSIDIEAKIQILFTEEYGQYLDESQIDD